MFGLDSSLTILLLISILLACAFEFINGFHDTANAVATVIYTNSLKPNHAVMISGFFNFIGVFAGGIAVAMGIVNLLPVELLIDQSIMHSVAMVLAMLLTAIIWNLGTWYYGIPCSSSHTLIGSILGVGIAFTLLPGNEAVSGVNWSKAQSIGLSLLVSPALGFTLTILMMYIVKKLISNPAIFEPAKTNETPPGWVRAILIFTCSGVSFSHGSNDGQKGVGLIMLVLIGIVPAKFSLDSRKNPLEMQGHLIELQRTFKGLNLNPTETADRIHVAVLDENLTQLAATLDSFKAQGSIPEEKNFLIRKNILLIGQEVEGISKSLTLKLSKKSKDALKKDMKHLKEYTDYAPTWVILMISLSLGIGTMVGWKRIVVTIGEKIGKSHLSYAQGASAELVAASTIGLAALSGLPVSTTHVLSSGITGSMVATGGLKNVQGKTLQTMALAWVLTLPVTTIMSGLLFVFFRKIL
ncbi:MAG: inorganic phosphate transporter [Bacteriovoracaceae bacterium]